MHDAIRFDFYSATVPGFVPRLVAADLASALGGTLARARRTKGTHNWAVEVKRGRDHLADVMGDPQGGEAYIATTGGACDDVVPVIRRLWPAHLPARVDAAWDFHGDFGSLGPGVVEVAKRLGVKGIDRFGPADGSDRGETLCLGLSTATR